MSTGTRALLGVVVLGALATAGWYVAGRLPHAGDPATTGDATAGADALPARDRVVRDDELARRLGTAAIAGAVRDPQGAPIAGATVCALTVSDLADDLRRFPACATSGDDGTYELDGLLAVPHRVVASAPNFIPAAHAKGNGAYRREALLLDAGADREGIDLTLRPGGVELRGVVRDLAGGVVEGAHLSSGPAHTRSDQAGAFTLWVAPGEVTVAARADGYTDATEVGVAPGHAFDLVVLPEAVLRGRVVLADNGTPVAGARVVVSAAGVFNTQRGDTTTDEHGRFRVHGLPPGAYKAEAHADEVFGLADALVPLGVGETSDPLEIRAHPAYLLAGLATHGDQGPCAQGQVRLDARGDGLALGAPIAPDGTARLRGVLPGPYLLTVTCPGALPLAQDIVVDQTQQDLRWELTRGQAIRGVVVDAGDAPVPGVLLTGAHEDPEGPGHLASARTEADGTFELAGLLPGRHRITFPVADRPAPPEATLVELVPGHDADGVRIVLPPTGRLHGRVVDPEAHGVAGVAVHLSAPGVAPLVATTADDGAFAFPHAPVGELTLVARRGLGVLPLAGAPAAEREAGRKVRVEAGATSEADLAVVDRRGAIRGRVVDPHGAPVADALVTAALESSRPRGADARADAPTGRPALTGADGRFTLEALPEGRYTLRARLRGSEAVATRAALGGDVALTLAAPAALHGVVRLRGAAPDRFTVEVRERAAGFALKDMFFRTGGSFSLPDLPAGRLEVRVDAPEGGQQVAVDLGEGEVRRGLDVALVAKVEVRGRLIDLDDGAPIAGVVVKLTAADGAEGGASGPVSDAEGRFTIARVPAGQAVLRASSIDVKGPYGATAIAVDVGGDGEVFELPPVILARKRRAAGEAPGRLGFTLAGARPGEGAPARVLVESVRPGSAAALAGLQAGDVITRIDGHPVAGPSAHLARALVDVPQGRTIALDLERGANLTLTAE